MNTVVLGGIETPLDSDLGRAFVIDCTRAGEGLISDTELAQIYEISPKDWSDIAKDAALGKAIRAERDRRVRSGVAAREAASKHFVRAPNVLATIMDNDQANARHRIESVRELRVISTPENQNPAMQGDRFHIVINLGADCIETYDKSRAVDLNPNDSEQPKLPERPKLTVLTGGFEDE